MENFKKINDNEMFCTCMISLELCATQGVANNGRPYSNINFGAWHPLHERN